MGFFDFLKKIFGDPVERVPDREAPERVKEDRVSSPPARMKADPSSRGLPVLKSEGQLASALGLSEAELHWLADPLRIAARRKPHYRLLVRPKSGGVRLVLAPRPRLKKAQRWILRNILDRVERSSWSHGFVTGRSIRTNAALHVGRDLLVQLDIRDFFHQFTWRDVVGLFRSLGYGKEVARLLAFLTTAPIRFMLPTLAKGAKGRRGEIFEAARHGHYRNLHPMLPQGAPTSPALADILSRHLDRRLSALARKFHADYSRYADDLTFSGGAEFRRDLRRFVPLVKRILREERLRMAPGKFRVSRKGGRQVVTGLVVNRKINVRAEEYRELRAIVHNCVRRGPGTQNRKGRPRFREHLLGRIAHVASVHPERGARLRAEFDRISW